MQQLEGFEVEGKENFVCRLKKSFYGLKQSPRQWYKRFNELLSLRGTSKVPMTHVFIIGWWRMVSTSIYYSMWMTYSKHLKFFLTIQKLKSLHSSEFEMKDMGATEKILSIENKRDRVQNKLFLYQKEYIDKVLSHFGMASTTPLSTPLIASIRLQTQYYSIRIIEGIHVSCSLCKSCR